MTVQYAQIIHDIVEKGLDAKYLAYLLERCDTKKVHSLVKRLNKEEREYDHVTETVKDSLSKEVRQVSISNRINNLINQIEEL